ncbi:uncharacterized protein LOC133362837 [Lethenteron reissneri]|uniref:uncharacterized protein LOC133362837 n=1 Tax=Lethenteron reissneri TaxID=7753 RepID=UPI002AB61D14|nr:uncharacterized protein LOC133362837 [Lethenteron reissneri]
MHCQLGTHLVFIAADFLAECLPSLAQLANLSQFTRNGRAGSELCLVMRFDKIPTRPWIERETRDRDELESVEAHHQAQLGAYVQTCTNLVRELGKRREALCVKVGCYENKYKDLGSEVDSLKRQGEQARSHESAELADYMEQIRHLEEAQSRRIAAEIENVKSGVERATQLKITEMSALVEEYKCDCDQQLEDKGNDCSSLERKYQDALENLYTVNEAQCDEMRAEMEKLKEALKQKTPPLLEPVSVAKSPYKGGILKPLATGEVVNRRQKVWYLSDSEGSEGSEIMDFTTPPWLAPVSVAKSPYKGGILKPLATGEVVKRRRKVLHLSDSDGSDVMDFIVDEELLASVSGVMPSKRTEQAGAAGKMRSDIVLTTRDEVMLPAVQTTPPWLAPVTVAKSPYKGGILKPLATGEVVKRRRKVLHLSDSDGSDVMDFIVDEELLASVSGVMPSKRTEQAGAAGKMRSDIVLTTRDEVMLPALQTTPPWLAQVSVAKSPYKGGILKPLATGEVVKRRRKVLHLSDSDGSDVMDFIVDEELLASVSGVMPSKRTEQAGAAGKMRSDIVLTTRDEVMLPALQTAIEISALTGEVEQEMMASASPSIKLPAKQRYSPFDWFDSPDVDTTSESED